MSSNHSCTCRKIKLKSIIEYLRRGSTPPLYYGEWSIATFDSDSANIYSIVK